MEWNYTNSTLNGTEGNLTTFNLTIAPSVAPSSLPTSMPSSSQPTSHPSHHPTHHPTKRPSYQPTMSPTEDFYANQEFGTFLVLIILCSFLGLLAIAAARKIHFDSKLPRKLEAARIQCIKPFKRKTGRSAAMFALSSKLKASNGKFQALKNDDESECEEEL
jgi:hypothetical protein